MKKLISILLCSFMILGLIGCGVFNKVYIVEEYGNKLKEVGFVIDNVEVIIVENDKN